MPMATARHQRAVNQPAKVMAMAMAMEMAMVRARVMARVVRKNPTKARQPHLKSQILPQLPPARKAALLPDIAKHPFIFDSSQ